MISIDTNKFGIWHWIILSGVAIIIFSIMYNAEYVFLGFFTIVYGALSFFLDILLDRLISTTIKEKLTVENMFSIKMRWHFIRVITHVSPLIGYLIIIISKYKW